MRSIYGRIRPLPGIADRNANIRKAAEREAINMEVQGSAADLIKLAMLNVYRGLKSEGFRARLLLQIHDELVFECPTEELAGHTTIG